MDAQASIDEKLQSVAPGTFRHTVLMSAKRFKASWVEFGKLLVKVQDEGLFEQWGYSDFEQYCLKELRIRKQTAWKLVRSFSFLNRHEPKAMQRDDIAQEAPAFEVVEVLADAEQRGALSANEYRNLRDSIWNADKPTSELRRELVDRFPRPVTEVSEAAQVRRLAGLARKLATELAAAKKVPRAIAERAEALAEDLEALGEK